MKVINVVAAIIKENDKILIAKRNYGEFKGLFEFPGGKVELGEDNEQALKREILEELNVEIEVNNFFMNVNYSYPNFILNMDCYLCELIDHNICLHDHSEVKWISVDEKNIKWVPADIEIIEKLQLDYGND